MARYRPFGLMVLLTILSLSTAHAQDKPATQIQPQTATPAVTPNATPAPAEPLFNQTNIVEYLEAMLAWQKGVTTAQPLHGNAREILLTDTMRQNANASLQTAFDFGRLLAPSLDTTTPVDEEGDTPTKEPNANDIHKFANSIQQRITALQTELNETNSALNRAARRSRPALLAQREKLNGEINLAKAQQELIDTISQTVDDNDSGTSSEFLTKINNLAKSVTLPTTATDAKPDTDKTKTADTATAPATTTDTSDSNNGSEGLIQLGSDIYGLFQKRATVLNLKQQGKDLRTQTREWRTALRASLQDIGRQGNALNQNDQTDVKTLEQQRTTLDNLTASFRQLSVGVVPLAQLDGTIDAGYRALKEWKNLLDDDLAQTSRKFVLRLSILGITILIPIILSEVAHRMTKRYVQDLRRQRQLRILRRVLLMVALLLIVMLNLVSEFGSLATFAGFLTAGLAVALQNVILSLAAHFFFFGRYGVRTGDRVTVSGVTGDVAQVGMIRLYLSEVEKINDEWQPTGKIVAFPNSILFQPTAFFKHIR